MRRITPSNYNNRIPQTMEKITLDANVASHKRIFFIVLFVCIGLGALAYGFTHLGGNKKGWQEIALDKYGTANCSYDFTLQYYLGSGKQSVNKEREGLIKVYQRIATHAYRVFDRDNLYEGIGNVCYLNQNINREITVDPVLYQALSQFVESGNREIYTCALSEHYDALIRIDSLSALSEVDPYTSSEVADFFKTVSAYAADSNAVSIELLSDNRLILHVSEEYLSYALANDIRSFVDFGWMKNAFIVDYMADSFVDAGYNKGILSSYDGFTRNFAELPEEQFVYNAIVFADGRAHNAAAFLYKGQTAFVNYRSYRLNRFDEYRILELPDGTRRNSYINPADGLCNVASDDLLVWSRDQASCSGIVLGSMKYYLTASADYEHAMCALREQGMFMLFVDGTGLWLNDASMKADTGAQASAAFSIEYR